MTNFRALHVSLNFSFRWDLFKFNPGIVQLLLPIVAELQTGCISFTGTVGLNEVGAMFDKDILTQLKNECGGIQTVLKNCPDVFCGEDLQYYIGTVL